MILSDFVSVISFCRETPEAQYSPLLLAAGRKEPPEREMIQTLLKAGADINFKCKYDTTALHEAVERGHTQVSCVSITYSLLQMFEMSFRCLIID